MLNVPLFPPLNINNPPLVNQYHKIGENQLRIS